MKSIAPLWTFCTLNDDVLKEGTDPGFRFEYVDISNVSTGRVSDRLEELNFADSPSRARRLARPGDVVISTVRTYLRAIAPIYEVSNPRVYSTGFAVVRPDTTKADSRFVQYCFTSNTVIDAVITHSKGVSYPAINASDIARIRIPLPDLPTQRRIADYLDRETAQIDAMAGALDGLVARLEERRRAAITSAVGGDVQGGAGMNSIAPLWTFCTLNDDVLKEGTDPGFRFEYVDISNVSTGRVSDRLEELTFADSPSRARRLARPGDVIISTVRTYLRAIAPIYEVSNPRVYSTGFAVVRPDTTKADSRFVQYCFTSNTVIDAVIRLFRIGS
ncbi:restriction endonuclease subunit S, partial [Corynebacterium nuruki]|uniref:restriction endonuclease subunit S n=1 Tax=Corynebacterium nuruki TaxID=1032851 RepID=UPI0039BF4966